jgi:hypothetical protein
VAAERRPQVRRSATGASGLRPASKKGRRFLKRRIAPIVALACGLILIGVLFAVVRPRKTIGTPESAADSVGQGTSADATDALTPEQRRELQRIATLGYVSGTEPVPERSGVLVNEPEAFSGPTLYSSSEQSAAVLIGMNGAILHSWRCPGFKSWGRVRLFTNGDLLVITEEYPHLMKINRNSELIWEWNKAAHHDVEILPDGSIAVLVSEETTRPYICEGRPFLSDSIVILTPGGRPVQRIPILDAFERSEYVDWFRDNIVPDDTDPLHANSLEVIDYAGRPSFLVSLRNIDAVVVVDPDADEVVRVITGPWRRQHEARMVEGGRILLFDNMGLGDQSRVIEYDPDSGTVVWSYTEPELLSKTEGAEQRLPNGDTLITESDNGRLVEVTRAGRVVWEYINPVTTVVDGRRVVLGIARAERLASDFPTYWAEGVGRQHNR